MSEFLTILILTPTAAVLAIGVFYVLGMIAMSLAAGVEAIIVTARHGENHPMRTRQVGHVGHTPHTGHA
jgi:hypothetical protein